MDSRTSLIGNPARGAFVRRPWPAHPGVVPGYVRAPRRQPPAIRPGPGFAPRPAAALRPSPVCVGRQPSSSRPGPGFRPGPPRTPVRPAHPVTPAVPAAPWNGTPARPVKPLPSVRSTFVGALLLGVLWLPVALRASNRADRQGVDGGRYIRIWLAGAALWLGIPLLILAVVLPAAVEVAKANDPWAGTTSEQVTVVAPVPVPSVFGRADRDSSVGESGKGLRSGGRKRR